MCGNSSTVNTNDILRAMSLSTPIVIFLNFAAVFTFSFLLWKKLREDYPHDEIFRFTLGVLIGSGVGWWAGQLLPGFAFWTMFAGGVIVGYLYLQKFNLKFFEIADAASLPFLVLVLLIYIGNLVENLPKVEYLFLVKVLSVILLVFLYRYFLGRYRSFRWYPSGKVGFAGMAVLALFFLICLALALYSHLQKPTVIFQYWHLSLSVEMVNVIISLALFSTLVIVLYKRSGR